MFLAAHCFQLRVHISKSEYARIQVVASVVRVVSNSFPRVGMFKVQAWPSLITRVHHLTSCVNPFFDKARS
jgi:hypothetical protein